MKKIVFFLLPLIASCTVHDAEICKFKDGRQAAVSLTFDDGILDHYTMVAPRLDRYGLKATFWINGANIGVDDDYAPRLTWDMCRKMAANGHEISNHAWSHKNLVRSTEEEIISEIKLNDEAIERELGARPLTFCFPYNASNEQVMKLSSEGRVGVRTFQEGQGQANSHSTAESLDAWLRKVIDNGEWGVTMTHGIKHGWDQWEDENVLWSFYGRLAAKRDSVWVDTFAAVSAYVAERDNCTIKVRKCGKKVTITPTCSLDSSIYKQPLTALVEGRYLEFDPFGGAQTFDLSDPLLGKTLNIIGDSYVRNHVRSYAETWHYKAADRAGMVYNNYGINGNCVAFDRSGRGFGVSMLDRFSQMRADADYVVVIAGHNDASMLSMMPDSVGVFVESLDLFCKGLKEMYPKAGIGFVTPWAVDRPMFPEVTQYIREACEKYSFVLLDATQSEILVNDPEFRAKYFQSKNDTAHLNPAGHDLLVDWGEAFYRSLK